MNIGLNAPSFDVTLVLIGAAFLFLCISGGGITFPIISTGFRLIMLIFGVSLLLLGACASLVC